MYKDRRVRRRILVVLLLLLLLILAVIFLPGLWRDKEPPADDNASQADIGTIEYQGKKYAYNTAITNILFLGVDNNNGQDDGEDLNAKAQADCIMLISLNNETKQASIIQIPRDTMTNVTIYDELGASYTKPNPEQIATQFSYAGGGAKGCYAVQTVVSEEILYGLPIDGYFAMKMSAIGDANDLVGGVELTIPEDYTRIDPAFVKGVTLRLTGEQAYDYVHYRDFDAAFSNNGRMQRQLDYVPAFMNSYKEKVASEDGFYEKSEQELDGRILTNLQVEEIEELAGYDLVNSEVQYLPGEGQKGETYEEFHADSEKTQKFLIETFYKLKN